MLEKILEYKLSQLKEKTVEQKFFIKKWEVKELLYVEPIKYMPFSHQIQKVKRMSKESIIARTEITLPKNIVDKKVYINIPVEENSNLQALLSINNKAVAGIDRFHTEILLMTPAITGRINPTPTNSRVFKFKIKIEGKISRYEWEGLRKGIYLFTINDEIEKYYFDLKVAYEVFQNSEDESLKMNLWKLMEDSVSEFNIHNSDFARGIKKSQQILSEGLRKLNLTYKPTGKISLIAHSHLDLAYHWELKETIRKCSRTFSTAINLMKEYSSFYFPSSQIQLYAYTKKYYPQLYAEIKERVKKGQWELIGGSWVENDCNLPSGESIVRQHLYGQRFFQKEFGKRTEISWMPDTFGFSGNLPQVLAGCGIKYFFTWKVYYQPRNLFPYNLFWWKGIDGSKILAHLPRLMFGYGGPATPKALFTAWKNFSEKNICDEMMSTYGYGDGGGGVTRKMLEYTKRYKHFPGFPECKTERADKFFKRINKKIKNNPALPVWKGEIYLETHRGTFTSKAILKKLNRKTENLFLNAEKISSLLMAYNIKPEVTDIGKGWKNLLLNQFHDIMAGTSEKEVNEEAVRDYQKAVAIGEKIIEKNLTKLSKIIDTSNKSNPIILFNTLSWNRDDIVEIKLNRLNKNTCIVDENGEVLDYRVIEQKENKILVFVKNIPSLGYKVLDVKEKNGRWEKSHNIKVSSRLMENDFYRIAINESGEIKIYDKIRKRDVFEEGRWGNVLEFFRENPDPQAAWNIDRDFAKHRDTVKDAKINIKETGPVRVSIQIAKRYHKSTIIQEMRIYKNLPRIDFKTKVNWRERNVMLKASFPVKVNSLRATYEIPYGNIERPTHTNTSWEQEKFEVPAQRWVDLSESGFGVSILNDSRYGYDIRDNLMRITLLRSPNYPEFDADRGLHEFCYSLITHSGDWRKGDITKEGYQFNLPVIARVAGSHQGRLTSTFSLVKVDSENVIIEVVKKAEDSNALIIRLYEYFGARGTVDLSFGFKVKEVYETDMLENKKRKLNLIGSKVSFLIKPYEIKTFLLQK